MKLIRKPLPTLGCGTVFLPNSGSDRLRSVSEPRHVVLALTRYWPSARSILGSMGFWSYTVEAQIHHASGEVGFSIYFRGGLADGWQVLEERKRRFKASRGLSSRGRP